MRLGWIQEVLLFQGLKIMWHRSHYSSWLCPWQTSPINRKILSSWVRRQPLFHSQHNALWATCSGSNLGHTLKAICHSCLSCSTPGDSWLISQISAFPVSLSFVLLLAPIPVLGHIGPLCWGWCQKDYRDQGHGPFDCCSFQKSLVQPGKLETFAQKEPPHSFSWVPESLSPVDFLPFLPQLLGPGCSVARIIF